MSVKVSELIELIENISPTAYAEKWDNCGLQVGDDNSSVEKVLLALSPTDEVIDYGIAKKVDMIITHHPLTISKISKINNHSLIGRKALKLIKNNIALYAAHTNLDVVEDSINDYLIDLFGVEKLKVLSPTEDDKTGFGYICKVNKPIALIDFAKQIKDKLEFNAINYSGDDEKIINTVAICSGSGMSFRGEVLENNVDCFITGDLKYHEALDAAELGLAVIDGTHFGTENIVIQVFERIITNSNLDVEILLDTVSKNPIKTIV